MKIVFNTRNQDEASAAFYARGFSRLPSVSFGDWGHYADYDIVLFMGSAEDMPEARTAKRENPDILVGLVDPRGRLPYEFMDVVDFLVLDSVEMQDFYAFANKPILRYCEYPDISPRPKEHLEKKKIIIGYHGNKQHLSCMYPRLTSAIDALGGKYDIELWAVYNIKALGFCHVGLPQKVPVRHIQWSQKVYEEELRSVDIGICPNMMMIRDPDRVKEQCRFDKYFLQDKDDFLIRFKMSSNPGRIVVFGLFGIPVVSDFLPSALQTIRDGQNGFIAYTAGGWYRALEKLIRSRDLRAQLGRNLYEHVVKEYGYDVQNRRLEQFCAELMKERPASGIIFGGGDPLVDPGRLRAELWRERWEKFIGFVRRIRT